MIRASAPGKVVLWGEYAVLAGAPALVMAVDRYAICELAPASGDCWQCSAAGPDAGDGEVVVSRLADPTPPPNGSVWSIFWHVLQTLGTPPLNRGGQARFDTSGFYHQATKLGLGSSAALCVAVYAAACRLLNRPADHAGAQAAHAHIQGGAGSGIDVAAAWHGGTLRYRRPGNPEEVGAAVTWSLPEPLRLGFVWTGAAARTTDHLARLRCWLEDGGGSELEALARQSEALFHAPDLLTAMADYVDLLDALDHAAALGIFSEPHRQLRRLAMDAGVVYKPCGAGGGDVGAALAFEAGAIERFKRLAAARGFLPLALETASHGIEVIS